MAQVVLTLIFRKKRSKMKKGELIFKVFLLIKVIISGNRNPIQAVEYRILFKFIEMIH